LRARILDVVSKNGGHLASSLGAVELACALVDVFDPEKDRIVWDVGHQAYAWKILTGRDDRFDTLRRAGGLSGFPHPAESPADAAVAGHAGVAISVAVGLAAARDLAGASRHVVAVVGDGAIANGVSFEALNNCAAATEKVIVVLNDNEMSISRPTGSLARLLGRLISGVRYNRVKAAAEKAGHALKLTFLRGVYHSIESRVKSLFVGNAFFEQFGLRYIGPIDGHDLSALTAALTVAKEDKRSVLVHVVTKKGRGYAPAEKNPTRWHGVGPFASAADPAARVQTTPTDWSAAVGDALVERARVDARICALTAGMTDGTGLSPFAAAFPSRFFDVGIAEEHLVAFAAGLAAGGRKPVIAVYSTFLQRAVDQVMHDVCLPNLPVVFCVDRAGIVGADGATHQGVFDLAMLRCLPNLTICQPKDAVDLRALLDEALARQGPTLIRYPRGRVPEAVPPAPEPADARVAIWTTGDWYPKAAAVAARVGGCRVVHARQLKPFDAALLARQRAEGLTIVSLENGSVAGGFGEAIGADIRFGWPDTFIPHGTPDELERRFGLDVDSIVAALQADGRARRKRDSETKKEQET
jgi:1-deoxy-D-xylulose-5-phosphate synthase